MPKSSRPTRLFALIVLIALAGGGCGELKMRSAIERLNASAPKGALPPRVTASERIARVVARHFEDSYYAPAAVSQWLEALAQDPEPLLAFVGCISRARREGKASAECHTAFAAPDGAISRLGVPSARPSLDANPSAPELRSELDAERFLANGRSLGAALSELEQAQGGALADAATGVATGARRASAYLTTRRWSRGERPTTALVLGGGSANGAFSAGFVYRLMEVLMSCRGAGAGACTGARLDLAVGTSTGTLIGALVDLFFTPGHEREAMALLMDNYTCSVEADLYCVPDEYFWKIIQDARGVVRFDGVASKIDRYIVPEVERNALELVGVTVDLRYGDVVGFSDQNPFDATAACGRRNALLASIVLPVLAEPVAAVQLRSGVRTGPFVDGGVSSIVPMLEAVRRGAERVVVLSNYPLVPEPSPDPRNAFDVLMRTLTLAMLLPGTTEIERGELFAMTRRRIEYDVCKARFARFPAADPAPDAAAVEVFCRRQAPATLADGARDGLAGTPWQGALSFPEVESSFQSAWVFRTDSSSETAQGYAFEPHVMRPLFALGVAAFQQRCNEVLDTLAIDGTVARAACSERGASDRIANVMKPIDRCPARELRECGRPIACSRP